MAITAPTLTNLDTTVFSEKVLHAYQARNKLMNDMVVFLSQEDGDALTVPVFDPGLAVNSADGAIMSTEGDTEAGPDIAYDAPMKQKTIIPYSQVTAKKPIRLQSRYQVKAGKALAEGYMKRFIHYFAEVASTADQNITGDFLTTNTTLGASVKAALETAAATLSSSGVDEEGRYVFLHPNLFYALAGEAEVQSVEYGGNSNIKRPRMLEYLNFMIHDTPIGFNSAIANLDANYATKYQDIDLTAGGLETGGIYGLIWHRDAMAVRGATTLPQIDVYDSKDYDGYVCRGRWHIGMDTVQSDGIYILDDDGS